MPRLSSQRSVSRTLRRSKMHSACVDPLSAATRIAVDSSADDASSVGFFDLFLPVRGTLFGLFICDGDSDRHRGLLHLGEWTMVPRPHLHVRPYLHTLPGLCKLRLGAVAAVTINLVGCK